MTHLTSLELVDALEGALGPIRREHLNRCGTCRRELERCRAQLADLEALGPVPEPSPLFWDHFGARVRDAVEADARRASGSWWIQGWRPLAALGAAVAAVAIAVGLDRTAVDPAPPEPAPSVDTRAWLEQAAALAGERPWEHAASAVSDLPNEQLDGLVVPEPGVAETLLPELTDSEREALARLVLAEMEGGE
jgi:hypothetical protein